MGTIEIEIDKLTIYTLELPRILVIMALKLSDQLLRLIVDAFQVCDRASPSVCRYSWKHSVLRIRHKRSFRVK